jgi:Effector Associated Constant Component 1
VESLGSKLKAMIVCWAEVWMSSLLTLVAGRGDQMRRLRMWLAGDTSLAGRVRCEATVPAPGELGAGVEALLVTLAPGGVAVAVVSGVFGWLRSRTTSVRLRLRRADGAELEIETSVAGRIPAERLPEVVNGLAAWACGGGLDPGVASELTEGATRAVEPPSGR